MFVPLVDEGRFAIVTMRGRDAVDGAARLTKRTATDGPSVTKDRGEQVGLRSGPGHDVKAARLEASVSPRDREGTPERRLLPAEHEQAGNPSCAERRRKVRPW